MFDPWPTSADSDEMRRAGFGAAVLAAGRETAITIEPRGSWARHHTHVHDHDLTATVTTTGVTWDQ